MSDRMKSFRDWGMVFAPDGRAGSVDQGAHSWAEDVPESERFDALMSLALDDMLNASEEAEFERMLAGNAGRPGVWDEWQAFDAAFQGAPRVYPPADFVASLEARMVRRDRRRRLWLGVGVAAIAVVLWSSLVMGLAGAGAYVMFNQAGWLTGAVRIVVQTSATVQSQVAMFVDAGASALATPQVQGMAVAYMVFAVMALWFWAKFLRRSVGTRDAVVPNAS